MSHDRTIQTDDQVVTPQPTRETRFRIYAVEPHGWSTVLIEDDSNHIYLCSTTASALTEVSAADAAALLANRSYRRWFGASDWVPLAQLPLVSASFTDPNADLSATASTY